MAQIYNRVPGKGGGKLEKVIATNDGVQDWMDEFIFEAAVRAEEDLMEHRDEGHAFIEIDQGDSAVGDRYLVLNDERGQKAAMSIEYGRDAYGIDADGNTVPYDSPKAVRKVGAMDGLFILHKAMHLRGKGKGRIHIA